MEQELAALFERDLLRLRDELGKFKDEKNIWLKADGITNSAGNLVLHLVGSISYTIGTLLGNTGYVRHREEEFSATDVPRETMIKAIEALAGVVRNTLASLDAEKLLATYPLEMYGQKNTGFYLMHFYGHLNYHLGQVNYLRRMLEG